jgi:hypothetical protein
MGRYLTKEAILKLEIEKANTASTFSLPITSSQSTSTEIAKSPTTFLTAITVNMPASTPAQSVTIPAEPILAANITTSSTTTTTTSSTSSTDSPTTYISTTTNSSTTTYISTTNNTNKTTSTAAIPQNFFYTFISIEEVIKLKMLRTSTDNPVTTTAPNIKITTAASNNNVSATAPITTNASCFDSEVIFI